ncbi:permease-like cell division protein FtsX [Nonomuraea sp. NPDC046802]|uniref:permease-like cell division protein FtsX n=1 Tax=Nonomuraea sp. NPDC046802 TaxID=3154919 RepID=UPI0033FBB453
MNSPMEARLREALQEAGATVDTGTLRPLQQTRPERRRVRADYRLVAAAVVVVLAGAATATGLGGGLGENSVVAANPERTPDGPTEMTVFLCTATSKTKEPKCSGREATADEAKEVEATLKQSQGVKEVIFIGKATAYDNFRRDFAHNKAVLNEVELTDMPQSFKVKLQEGADNKQLESALHKLSGVLATFDDRVMLSDQANPKNGGVMLSAFLCSDGSGSPSCGGEQTRGDDGILKTIKPGNAVTDEQRDAIRALLEKMPEIESSVYESKEYSYENFRRAFANNQKLMDATTVEDMPEVFRLKVKPQAKLRKVAGKLERQPGVSTVFNNSCSYEAGVLVSDYGLFLPEKKVCPAWK